MSGAALPPCTVATAMPRRSTPKEILGYASHIEDTAATKCLTLFHFYGRNGEMCHVPMFTGFRRLQNHFVFSGAVFLKSQGFNYCFKGCFVAGEVSEKTERLGKFLRVSGKNREAREMPEGPRKKY